MVEMTIAVVQSVRGRLQSDVLMRFGRDRHGMVAGRERIMAVFVSVVQSRLVLYEIFRIKSRITGITATATAVQGRQILGTGNATAKHSDRRSSVSVCEKTNEKISQARHIRRAPYKHAYILCNLLTVRIIDQVCSRYTFRSLSPSTLRGTLFPQNRRTILIEKGQ